MYVTLCNQYVNAESVQKAAKDYTESEPSLFTDPLLHKVELISSLSLPTQVDEYDDWISNGFHRPPISTDDKALAKIEADSIPEKFLDSDKSITDALLHLTSTDLGLPTITCHYTVESEILDQIKPDIVLDVEIILNRTNTSKRLTTTLGDLWMQFYNEIESILRNRIALYLGHLEIIEEDDITEVLNLSLATLRTNLTKMFNISDYTYNSIGEYVKEMEVMFEWMVDWDGIIFHCFKRIENVSNIFIFWII